MDWKAIVASVAPGLATALGGPLAGGVVAVLADKLLGGSTGDSVADEAKLASVLSGGLTPELRAQVLQAEQALKLAVIQAGLEERRIEADKDKAAQLGVQDARARDLGMSQAGRYNWRADVLAFLAVGGLVACVYFIARDAGLPERAVNAIMFVAGVLASAVRDVYGFEFGSSRSSRDKDLTISDMAKR